MKRSTRYVFSGLLWLLNLPLVLAGIVIVLNAALHLLPLGGQPPRLSWTDGVFWWALLPGVGLIAVPTWFCIVFTRHQQAAADWDEEQTGGKGR